MIFMVMRSYLRKQKINMTYLLLIILGMILWQILLLLFYLIEDEEIDFAAIFLLIAIPYVIQKLYKKVRKRKAKNEHTRKV